MKTLPGLVTTATDWNEVVETCEVYSPSPSFGKYIKDVCDAPVVYCTTMAGADAKLKNHLSLAIALKDEVLNELSERCKGVQTYTGHFKLVCFSDRFVLHFEYDQIIGGRRIAYLTTNVPKFVLDNVEAT